jgi:hypothetical protein
MSIGNTKTEGNKGNNAPYQLKVLKGLQESLGSLFQINSNIQSLISAIQSGKEFEVKLVVDSNSQTWLEVRIWNSATEVFDPPLYYLAGSNIPGTPVLPISYINPDVLLSQIAGNTTGINLEATQLSVLSELQSINNSNSLLATEATLSTLASWITANAATDQTLNNLLVAFNLTDFATEITLNSLNTWIQGNAATESTLQSILLAIQNGTEYEAKLIVDSASEVWLEVRIWNTSTGGFNAPQYYKAGSNVVGTPLAPISYINPTTLLSQIASNTTGLNLEVTQQLVLTELQNLNTAAGTLATEATLAALSLWITTNSATEATLSNLLTAFNNTDFATEPTLAALNLTTTNAYNELLTQGITLDDIENLVTTLNSITATEITLQSVVTELQNVTLNTTGLSQEATQLLVLAAVNTVISNTTGLATEVTLSNLLTAFNLEDFASETTLAALNLWVQGNAATEATLQSVLNELQTINVNTNALNQEVTQLLVLASVNNVISNTTGLGTEATLSSLLNAFNNEDFATESTLSALNVWLQANAATEVTLQSVVSELQSLNTSVPTLSQEATQLLVLSALNNIFGDTSSISSNSANLDVPLSTLATEVTLQAVLTALTNISSLGLATETTLLNLFNAFTAEDFATELTLSTLSTWLQSNVGTESTLQSILSAIQSGTEFEAKLVIDANSDTWLEVRIWNTSTGSFNPPQYYLAGSNTPGTPVAPVSYVNPTSLLSQITLNTTGINLEVTQQAILTQLQNLNIGASALATESTLAALTAWITTTAATEATLNSLLLAFNTTDFATETTLNSIDTTSSNVLAELLNQGLTLDDIETALNTLNGSVATDLTLQSVLTELQGININTNGLSQEATQLLVLAALNTVVSNSTGLATEVTLDALLTAFNAEDFATETTLSALNVWVQANAATETTLQSVFSEIQNVTGNTTGLNLEATQQLVLTALNNILLDTANLDAPLSTLSTEATSQAILSALTPLATEATVNSLLIAFNAEDFATETTLDALSAWVQGNASTEATLQLVLGELQSINIDTNGLSQEATQLLVLAALNTVISNTTGLATEATLALIETVTSQITFTGNDLNVSANLQVGGTDVSGSNPVPVTAASLPLPAGAATEVTLSAVNTKLNAVVRVPNLIRATGSGTIAVDVYDFSVANVGSANGSILGDVIKPRETLNFGAGSLNNYYAASTIVYDGTGTELVIIYNS